MPHRLDLILTFTGGLTAALVCGLIAQRARLSPIVGYLLAGILIGPATPGFDADPGTAEQLAELGVVLLMFGVGLHFDVRELLAVRRVAIPGALAQIGGATALGALVTYLAGWTVGAGLVFGLAISVASTVVLLRVLSDNDALHTPAGHVAVGWLIVEDLFTVLLLVLLPALAEARATGGLAIAKALAISVGKLSVLVVLTLVLGQRGIPRLLAWVARTRSRELFTLSVLVIALGVGVGAAVVFDASMALGAFLAGTVVGQSRFSARAAAEALPMRDAFAVLFFVSMGMLFDPRGLGPQLGLIAATLAVVLVAKPLVAFVVVRLLKQPPRTAVTVAIALAQIGEFSFILATVGRATGILPSAASQALVVTALVSIALNPLAFRLVEPLTRRSVVLADPVELRRSTEVERRVVIVGYGPVGRTVTRLLQEQGFVPTVIEQNPDTVEALLAEGYDAVHGDAAQVPVLEAAGVRTAGHMVYTAHGPATEPLRVAKELNPELVVLVRTHYLGEVPCVLAEGADAIVNAELEVALAMSEWVLREVGATAEQIDRVRDQVRGELATTEEPPRDDSPGHPPMSSPSCA